jgi:FeS assembly protein SufD
MMSDLLNNETPQLEQKVISFFKAHFDELTKDDSLKIKELRLKAIEQFERSGFPNAKMETWRNSMIISAIKRDFSLEINPVHEAAKKNFNCEIHDFDTETVTLENASFADGDAVRRLENGIIVAGTKAAMKAYPELFEKHFGTCKLMESDGFIDVNTALWQDGFFIYVPKNVKAEKPIQVIKLIESDKNPFLQTRNLIILEEGADLQIVDCDDSIDQESSLINSFTEIFLGENSHLDKYKLQNINDNAILLNSNVVRQLSNSVLQSNTLSFNGGIIRNNIQVALNGEGADAKVLGLYLMDKKQHVDNQLKVSHDVSHCNSFGQFKGILDDEATAVFNGHVYVQPNAQKTTAYQNNSNIILTPTAKVNTMPFLEIYADDVKCSHGTSTGQLDQEAMFYLRQRGISEANAKMLLMYAFAAEISNHIAIDQLRERIDDMIKKRLRGELSSCDNCVLRCSKPKEYNFDIDYSKI